MPIKIVPQLLEHEPAVLAFNQRMQDGGSPWGFYSRPDDRWLPRVEGAKTWREYYLAIEDEEHVRGAYALKPQQWLVGGALQWVCDWQGPFSEGAINPKYATLGLRFIRDMLKRYPLLFSAGHGGLHEPMVQLLRSLGWKLHSMPFCIKVLRPHRFLRRNGYLRRSALQRLVLDFLAWSGSGSVAIPALHKAISIASGRGSDHADATVVDRFDLWTDDIWTNAQLSYACLAVRDSAMMNALIPSTGLQNAVRLRVDRGGDAIGWAVVHHAPRTSDARFGDLGVGLISDCFGAPRDAPSIIGAASRYLARQGIDLIYSNQSHPAWIGGFRRAGYVTLADRRLFACSPELARLLHSVPSWTQGLHLTNMDGHGPHGFA
jgi:hypothetical protein